MKRKIPKRAIFLLILAVFGLLIFTLVKTNILPANIFVGDKNMKSSAQLFIDEFKTEYPNAYLTKIRWQYVPDNQITYIIDGIENNKKYSVKYLDSSGTGKDKKHITILGRVERDLNKNEVQDGTPKEKPLIPEDYISGSKIEEIAKENSESKLQEWKVVWIKGKEYIQMILWGKDFIRTYIALDPRTGELIEKY